MTAAPPPPWRARDVYARSVRPHLIATVLLALTACACGDDDAPTGDAGSADAGTPAADAGPVGVDAPPDPRDAGPAARYGADGPIPYTTMSTTVTNGGDSFDVTVYLPTGPGPFPAVSFSCGSTQSAAGYLPYAERLASHGIAMFLTDDAGVFTNTADIVPNAVYLVETWIPESFPTIDTARIGLGGHSRGGAVSLLAAEHGLRGRVVAWFGLDPVDNQFLMAPREYARTDLPMIGIPTGFLGAEIGGNCAPAADSYPTLAPLAPDPTVLIVGLGAAHTDFEVPAACTACDACSPDGTVDPAVVLAYAVRYFTAFFARELLGDAAVGPRFEGAGGPEDIAAGLITVE